VYAGLGLLTADLPRIAARYRSFLALQKTMAGFRPAIGFTIRISP
jgi:hypothetical protein